LADSTPNAIGLSFFYMNWKAVAEASKDVGRRSYCVDWMGMGRSARVNPRELHAGKKATVQQRVYTVSGDFSKFP
jgi:cardiolipin-specific phospholipase